MGINTGEVLAGHVGDSYTVIGDTVNVAARIQAAARPGSVTVGEATYRATREAIDYSALSGAAGAQGQDRAGACLGGARRGRQPRGGRLGGHRASPARGPRSASSPSCTICSRGCSASADRIWRRSSAIPASASRGFCGTSSRSCRVTRPRRWCATGAACRMGRASSTGRSARSFAPSADHRRRSAGGCVDEAVGAYRRAARRARVGRPLRRRRRRP